MREESYISCKLHHILFRVILFQIDINDIALISIKYNLKKGNSGWNNNYDLNKDGIIDLFDLVTISKKI